MKKETIDKLLFLSIGMLAGVILAYSLPEPYADPNFTKHRIPEIKYIPGRKLKNGEEHPVYGKDEKGFYWYANDQFSECLSCHRGWWTSASGHSFNMRLACYRDADKRIDDPNSEWDGVAHPKNPAIK